MSISEHAAGDMATRLHLYTYSEAACRAAIRGERVPYELGLPVTRLCFIRGLRYCDGFGEELRGMHPTFTRALNARSIMSNRIPDIKNNDEIPYCIWYPQTASEATYRELAHRYPHMSYHVGRACAVAGYTELYKELDILPDVHIAEEARECGNMAIFDYIMSQPMRYDVMNDSTLTIATEPKSSAHLNGDMAICSSLDDKQRFRSATEPDDVDDQGEPIYELFSMHGFKTNTFNITEDMNLKEMSMVRQPKPILSSNQEFCHRHDSDGE